MLRTSLITDVTRSIRGRMRSFAGDRSGQIAIIFGLSVTALMLSVGGGIDLSRAYQARQKLSEAAALACQYASRPSVVQYISPSYSGSDGAAQYSSAVTAYLSNTLTSQRFPWTQTNAAPFTYTVNGPANVNLTANVPTTMMSIVNISQIPISAGSYCYDNPSTLQQEVANGNSLTLVQESFEATQCTGTCWSTYDRNGAWTRPATPNNTFPATPGYTGITGIKWYVMGYCAEIDAAGELFTQTADGTHAVELDCDNGSYSAGNSSMSTKVYLPVGNYEVRYNYRSRILYPNYSPAYICGSSANDVAWANDTSPSNGSVSNALRSNQVNVYLDQNVGNAPALHTTMDGYQQLAGSNLIDVCVYAPAWIERSVRIYVTTAGHYWLSFAADGQNDSVGGSIDNVRLCQMTCPTALQDNFPTAWLPSGGVNKVLFQDGFESPVYAQDPYTSTRHAKGGNLAASTGTTVTTGCLVNGSTLSYPSPPGWPCQTLKGWAVAPYNQVWFWMQGATSGNQYLSLQGWNGFSNSSDPINRAISRPFLLDPGHYNVSYYYTSLMDFSYDFVYTNNYYNPACVRAPSTPNSLTAFGKKNGHVYGDPATVYNQYLSTNFMNVYMASGQLISTPSINSTLGGAPTYTNPNGTTSSTPTVPPDNGSIFAAYNNAVNPVLDSCRYYSSFAWAQRSIDIKISKPGLYWLTFSSQGDPLTANGAGPAIDDVKLTALGSLSMAAPPSSPVSIPVADPQPGSRTYFTGFYIVADPLIPPAALQ